MRRAAVLLLAVAACTGRGAPSRDGPDAAPAAGGSTPPATSAASVVSSAAPHPAAASGTAPAPQPGGPPRGCRLVGRGAHADAPGEVAVLVSPRTPRAGARLRIVAVSETPVEAALVVRAPDGTEAARVAAARGGPPWWWIGEVAAAASGAYRIELEGPGGAAKCPEVSTAAEPERERGGGAVWSVRSDWDRATENLYAAWIEKLFDDPLDKQPSWPALHEVLREPARNYLHGHLGLSEDDAGAGALVIDPDCADLPFFLRAYFAYKLGLPFGYSGCSRGGSGGPPRCVRWHNNLEAREKSGKSKSPVAPFGHFLRVTLADTVHSGSGRTPATDDETDFYPVALSAQTLRPGTIYADPYGHVLVVARRIAQTPEAGGVMLAVDGQPDGTVSRRRFWRGNFLFASDPKLGSPGFKRFRPVVREGGRLRQLSNEEIRKNPVYGDYSLEQYEVDVEGFYDRMDDVLSPAPLDPARAMRETIQALEEQVTGRVLSVHNGVKHLKGGGGVIDMPDGAAIFETTGDWEDFSTPSRDLRLLIAIDVVRSFPERAARRPERYAASAGKKPAELRAELEAILASELSSRRVSYERSDGSQQELSLSDVVSRAKSLEMAYNPNDCPETRWGAPPGSPELATCRGHAPADQRAKMAKYREWFSGRRRPPRP